MPLFLSATTNKVDKKGRVSVPASFRAAIGADGYQGVVIYPSFLHDCLDGTDRAYMQDLSDSIYDEHGPYSEESDALANALLSSSYELPFDPEGRVMLPADLIEHAGLGEAATFVGKGEMFQIWNPDSYQEFRKDQMELAREQARKLRPGKMRRRHGRPNNGEGEQ